MQQVPDPVWNEIAASQPLHQPFKTLFKMMDEEMIDGIHSLLDKTAEDQGADNKTVLAYRLTAPLLLENEAISAYIVATGYASLRTSLPELVSVNEALMLATEEYRLSEFQQGKLKSLLKQALKNQAAQPAPTM
jgi:phosphoglycerate-specific signal transduction histidine kinase